MRILVIYQDWDGTMFGKEGRFFHWFGEKDGGYDQKHEYHVIALSRKEGRERLKKNLTVDYMKSTPLQQFFIPRLRRRLTKAIDEFKPEWIYSPFLFLLAAVPRTRGKTRVAAFVRDKTPEMVKARGGWRRLAAPLVKKLDRIALSKTDVVFHNGPAMAAYAKECGYKGRLVYAPRPITDKEVFADAKRERVMQRYGLFGKKVILTVARLTAEKDIGLGIRAMKFLPAQYMHLIVGEGEERGKLEKLAKDEGVESRVVFVGNIAHKEIWEYYRAAEVFWLLSTTEGAPNVLQEAFYSRVPCIVSDIPGMRTFIKPGKTGIIIKKRDPRLLAQATIRIMRDKTLRERVIRGAVTIVETIERKRLRVIDELARWNESMKQRGARR